MLNNNIIDEKNKKKTSIRRIVDPNRPLMYPRFIAESMFLSFDARGLYAYLLTLPKEFDITAEFLYSHFQNPQAWPLCYFEKLLDELIEFGHVEKKGGKS